MEDVDLILFLLGEVERLQQLVGEVPPPVEPLIAVKVLVPDAIERFQKHYGWDEPLADAWGLGIRLEERGRAEIIGERRYHLTWSETRRVLARFEGDPRRAIATANRIVPQLLAAWQRQQGQQ